MPNDYVKARKQGEKSYNDAIREGRYPYLLSLDGFLSNDDIAGEVPIGRAEIPLSLIAGTRTAGRENSFAPNFMPLLGEHTEFARKWQNLFEIQSEEGFRDPVLVFEYMHKFYVQEGNKRVSVLKYLNGVQVPAEITRILPKKTEDPEVVAYYEFVEFHKVTGLYGITSSRPGAYHWLAWIMGESLSSEWPEEKVEDIAACYDAFTVAYEAFAPGSTYPTGDAFFNYLGYFGLDTLRTGRTSTIRKQLLSIKNEISVLATHEEVAVIDTPDADSPSVLKNILNLNLLPSYTQKNPLKVAMIYERNPETSSWCYGHELGRHEIDDTFRGLVKSFAYTDCYDDDTTDAAIEDAVKQGANVVFTTSPFQMGAARRAGVKYHDLMLFNCSINQQSSAVRTYYPRFHEAKYLLGALAATFAEDHRIGYIADYPIYSTVASINAFALGASSVDPYAKVYLKWSRVEGSDPEKEFLAEGIRLFSGGDLITPSEASRKYGIYRVNEDGSITNYGAPIWHWGNYYEIIVRSILNGSYKERENIPTNKTVGYWYGMSGGVVDIILSDRIPYTTAKTMNFLRWNLIEGRMDPFYGEIHSQDGTVIQKGMVSLKPQEIIKMDWFADNVVGALPFFEELNTFGKRAVMVSGVAPRLNHRAGKDPET